MNDPISLALLGGASFLASLTSASLSIGGGYILFGATTLLFPLSSAIALQPVLSYSSLLARSIAFRDAIAWNIVRPFTAGSIIGVGLGLLIYHLIPERALSLAVGIGMLTLAWTRPALPPAHTGKGFFLVGGLHALAGTVLGLGSVLQPVLLNSGIARRAIVGTFATCLLALEAIRFFGYAKTGFSYAPFIEPIFVAIITGIAGTWVGGKLIGHIPEQIFRLILRLLVSLVALRLIAIGLRLHD